jgi:hypothetical protein
MTHIPPTLPAANITAARPTRRTILRAGALGLAGLNLADFFRYQAQAAIAQSSAASQIRSCILVFFYGGPSHHETWDMKLSAPREVRGDFEPIQTNVPGLVVGQHLPHCAQIMDRLCVVRSLHHPMRNHNSAAVEALCGRTPLRGDLELLANDPTTDFPCYGSALSRLSPGDGRTPVHVALPHVMHNVVMLPGQTAGFLGATYEPFQVTRDPSDPNFRVSELSLPAELSTSALSDRRKLLSVVDQERQIAHAEVPLVARDAFYDRAFDLLSSDGVRQAFDLAGETDATRDRYGRNKLGQSLLLSRRLVESGVKFVNVNDKIVNGLDNWDTHVENFRRLKDDLLPPADRGFSALVEDLDTRGLLDSTLVIWIGEFGRTPKISSAGGRDHWPDCFSVVLAGGGVKGGTTYGRSDKLGAYPDRDPCTPGDLAATIFWRFGLDPAQTIYDGSGRPYRLAEGEPLRRVFAV